MSNILKPYAGKEPYIFISYAHIDRDCVFPIIGTLQQAGYRVWYDEGIDPGTEWAENIAEHVAYCDYFIAFMDKNYLESQNCKEELNFARDNKKGRLIIYLEEVELSLGLSMQLNPIQAIYFYKYDQLEEFYEKLFQTEGLDHCKKDFEEENLIEKGKSANDGMEAYEYFYQAAMNGNAEAQLNLGMWYMTGQYYPPDDESAFGWYMMAAENGNAIGQYYVGIYYEDGIVVDKDYQKAREWLEKAATQGNKEAREHLSSLLYND